MKKIKIATFKDLLPVKVIESGEKMENISQKLVDCICVCHKPDMKKYTGNDIFVRKTVADKLQLISDKLIRKFPGCKLKIVYGYRHPDVQNKYFMEKKSLVYEENLNLSHNQIVEIVHTMVAAPYVAGHPTGGAVDITITSDCGDWDMGTKIADYADPEKIKTHCNYLTDKQKENRIILHDLLISEGFTPYYGEWWHFSYGDKEWAWFYNKPNSIYDQINFPTNINGFDF